MSKQVTITPFCDGERHEPNSVPATAERIGSIDRIRAHVVDVCDDCAEVLDAARALLERGMTVDAARDRPLPSVSTGVLPCPEPGCMFTAKSRVGLGMHTSRIHRRAMDSYANPDVSTMVTCPEPDCGYECATRQAMSKHTMRTHDRQLRTYEAA